MCRSQCLLTLLALAINCANSWDIGISQGDTIQFYTSYKEKTTNTSKVRDRSRDVTALAYDAVHNMLLFVDKQDDNASIFSYHFATKMALPIVGKKAHEDIQGIAFDPVTSSLFWTDRNDRSIYWKSLRAGASSSSDVYGKLLLKLDEEIPKAIAVDSCRGYVYWTNINIKPTIKRARFDGSEKQTVIDTDIYMPTSIVIDQRTRKLYWADDKEGIHFSIESADIDNPKKRTTLLKGIHHQPFAMTVTKDDIYWVDLGYKSVWKLPKNSTGNTEETQLIQFDGTTFDIVGNYSIEDQTENITECANLVSYARNKTVINHDFNFPTDAGVHCLHGVRLEAKVGGLPACKCTPGYVGERCEINVCQNYCVHGSCSVTGDGTPGCSCKSGYTGDRCEVDMCHGFCLNHGLCSVEDGRPMCSCSGQFEGLRCETVKSEVILPKEKQSCNCTNIFSTQESSYGEFVPSCVDGWDPIRDPILMALGTLCGLLAVACMVLVSRVLQLKKRPRIRKRIIVNKNVTPLTARPDQCEITIENCCNMNICETPCFEPRSTIRPSLLDSKPGREEKKNLIANMELPDDY